MDWLITVGLLTSIIYLINEYIFNYWTRRKYNQIKPKFIVGNAEMMAKGKSSIGEMLEDFYHKSKHERFIGAYLLYRPILIVNDVELIQNILINNFSSFHDRPVPINEEEDPLSANLFFLNGKKWRDLRRKSGSMFTGRKLNTFFPHLAKCANIVRDYLEMNIKSGINSFDFCDLMGRYTTNIISTIALGLEIDCINERDHIIRDIGIKVFDRNSLKQKFKIITALLLPKLFTAIKLHLFRKDVEEFIFELVKRTVEYREENNIQRNDFLQLLIDTKNYTRKSIEDETFARIRMNEITANSFLFFVGGYETTSSTIFYCLYEIAKNQEIQDKIYSEIKSILSSSLSTFEDITPESLKQMSYLGCCVKETLRKYPTVPFIVRTVTKDYQIPQTNLILEKGTSIYVSLLGIQRDEKFYENPMEFQPERFLKSKAKPFYLPFGKGPRSCIGIKYSTLVVKLAIATLVKNFKISLPSENIENIEVKFHPVSFSLTPLKRVSFNIELR